MNRRTLLLLIGAISVGVLYGGDQLYRWGYEQPLDRLNTRLDGLVTREKKIKTTALEARRDIKRLDVYNELSLPYDAEQARARYQQWLLELIDRHQMTQASVDPAQPRTIDVRNRTRSGSRTVATRFPFQLRARTTLARLTEFMQEFMQAGHLHKITAMTLNPTGSEVDITLSIEALSIDDCDRESELSTQTWTRTSGTSDDWAIIPRRNFFARGFSQALSQTRLSAITYGADGEAEAWFRVGESSSTQQIRAGGRLDIALFTVEVIDILPDQAFLRIDGQSGWLPIGSPLGQLIVDPQTQTSESTEPAASEPVSTEPESPAAGPGTE